MSEEVRNVVGLNFDPDDPNLLCNGLGFPVRLQGTTTRTPHPDTDYPGGDPEDPEDADLHLGVSRAGSPRRGRQKLTPLDIDLECIDTARDRITT
jgi:hypothetical protein